MSRYIKTSTPHICGFYYYFPASPKPLSRRYLPVIDIDAHVSIQSSVAKTTLRQTFVNPSNSESIEELRYTFPLYDGVSVVAFSCTIGSRIIKGVVKEREQARKTYQDTVARGETAALLEQLPDAADVFTTTVGNVPPKAEIHVQLVYLGELKYDAEMDGIRYTIPTAIAPRFGSYPGELLQTTAIGGGIMITVDIEMPAGSAIMSIQSPSHKISLHIGVTSTAPDAPMSLEKGHLTLTDRTTQLEKDFVVLVSAQNSGDPMAILEEHPTIPNHRALMATLVPRFSIPSIKPEIVFICDRSGSMGEGRRIPNVVSALSIFLKSLPLGVKFNICSFGSRHSFLWNRSKTYSQQTMEEAIKHIHSFSSNFGGTNMLHPVEDTFKRRYKDMNLEVFLLTDGEIWNQQELFDVINGEIIKSDGSVRIFTLGIGDDVSHALIEGTARAGNGFAQTVTDTEKMDAKVIKMLKACLTPHVAEYTLEVKYGHPKDTMIKNDDDFELIEKVQDAIMIDVNIPANSPQSSYYPIKQKVISLFDKNLDLDKPHSEDKNIKNKYDHLPRVDEPKLLQAPFKIPPLFPNSRSSVYLLFSSNGPSKPVKSVLLRGLCEHGPLELEIPVTTLAEKGETIHQLAAKKAIKELEEGRGWLKSAKTKCGKLLSKKYEGQFSDMVEREAVRLGVQYQVGGKWCSFVAVESNDGLVEKTTKKLDTVTLVEPQANEASFQSTFVPTRRKMLATQTKSGAKKFLLASRSSSRACSLEASDANHSMAPVSPNYNISEEEVEFEKPTHYEVESNRSDIFDTNNQTYPPVKTRSQYTARTFSPTIMPDRSVPKKQIAYGSRLERPTSKDILSSHDSMSILVSLQTFEGFWKASDDEFWRAVSISQEKASELIPELKYSPDILATVVAISFFRNKLAAEKDAWEMMVEKAEEWVKNKTGKEVDGWVTILGSI